MAFCSHQKFQGKIKNQLRWKFHSNTPLKWLSIPFLALFVLVSVMSERGVAKEVPSPFETSTDRTPHHTDPVQNQLMNPVNMISVRPDQPAPSDSKIKTVPTASQSTQYRLKVMLDPGHGGKDDGAAGRHGIREKQVSLLLAKKIKREVESIAKKQGYPLEVQLTRENDTFIPLKERVRMANNWGADMFVSIHLNSSPVPKARGFEVYFLSPEASDPETERLALKESEGQLPSEKSDVLSILSDVRTTFHTNESAQFAEDMFTSISKRVLSNGRGVRQGPFTVLHGTNMPAILVEVGYVTHPQESFLLTKEAYLKRLASAISSGIIEFGLRTRKLG